MKLATFFTFVGDNCGKAKEAIELYTSLFPDAEVKQIIPYDEGEAGGSPELIKFGIFTLNGIEYGVSESTFGHKWGFTPGVSILTESNSEEELQVLFEKLSANGGQVMVPWDHYETGDYGTGKKFGWCEDRYGVSWQFVLV